MKVFHDEPLGHCIVLMSQQLCSYPTDLVLILKRSKVT